MGGQTKDLYLHNVVDKSDFSSELKISAEVQANGAIGHASAKVEFTDKVKITEDFGNFTVHATVLNGAKYAAPPESGHLDLTQHALTLASQDYPEFLRQCGDAYVGSIVGGAELSAILTFRTQSNDEKKTISTKIEGSGWGLQAKGDVASVMEQYASKNELTIFYHESGGSGDPIPTDQAGLVQTINNLPKSAADSPTPFRMTLSRYENLPSWPGAKKGWVYSKLEPITTQYARLRSLRDQTQYMISNSSLYILDHGVTVQGLKDLTDELDKHISALKADIQRCVDSKGGQCDIASEDAVPDYTFRVQLPVAVKSFDADVKLSDANKALADAKAALERKPDELRNELGGPNNRVVINPVFLEKVLAPYRKAVEQQQQVVSRLQANYPDDLKAAIKRQWIEVPGRARCDKDVSGCLPYAEIDAWAQKIKVK